MSMQTISITYRVDSERNSHLLRYNPVMGGWDLDTYTLVPRCVLSEHFKDLAHVVRHYPQFKYVTELYEVTTV